MGGEQACILHLEGRKHFVLSMISRYTPVEVVGASSHACRRIRPRAHIQEEERKSNPRAEAGIARSGAAVWLAEG